MRILPQQVDWLELEAFTTTVMNAETVQREIREKLKQRDRKYLPTREQIMSVVVTAHPLITPF